MKIPTRKRVGTAARPATAIIPALAALALIALMLGACSNPTADSPPDEGNDTAAPTAEQQSAVAPSADPTGGSFEYPPVLALTSEESNAEIRYTMDGSEPTADSTLYADPFELPVSRDPVVLSLRAFVDGMDPSSVVTEEYVIERGPVLTLQVLGSGTITPDPDAGRYRWDESVTLVATAEDGHTFVGWSGDLSGTDPSGTVIMDSDRNVTATFEADTPATGTSHALRGGIVLNEFLPDPSGPDAAVDTDGNGTAADADEFVELYNASTGAVDLAGIELWDAGYGNWFTFPENSVLEAGGYAVVVAGVQDGGTLPDVPGGSVIFGAGRGGSVLNNGSDNLVVLDPGGDAYLQAVYNGDDADAPAAEYSGFPGTASIVDGVEDWGSDVDGNSLGRLPDGTGLPTVHGNGPNGAASPGGPNGPAPAATSGRISLR